ncbi:type III restriction/modification enzyme restriction subunit [Salegentibacter sp. 24]|uniref:DEAD/DEAH box helicase n=1 Tax=Salegentibacter sp. 24 TaxID=2183986 RepID=UPI00105E34E7|nr:DEAD/DEAH box helicase [Salegentibacter sp. 24]TDN81054.1 type III restriction/modification enzyme restriction subunit [Salegentibacter sp. 24]
MAFKSVKKTEKGYSDIESLFRDLPTKGIESLYSHQADIIRYYQEKSMEKTNVAIELPTGSGKTLVGLLIGEFRRRKLGEKVLYLCPTRQLVNQVVEISNNNYGINTIAFTGSHRNYEDSDKFKYKNGDAIAVSTYSSLFNTNPWFEEPDLIILDDAHTSENYIASCWSLSISRYEEKDTYRAVIDVLKDSIPYSVYNRMIEDDIDGLDKKIIEKYPGQKLFELKEVLFDVLSEYLNDHRDLKYSWSMVKNNLEACQLYYSWNEILIRPLVPPSLDNYQFQYAKQRILMSATLGQGGDLERITGIKKFNKIPIPKGWDKQGIGRRFFIFPSLSLSQENTGVLCSELLESTKRSVILVSSDNEIDDFRSEIKKNHSEMEFFTAKDIEVSKNDFVNSENAAMVLANRFDGIDFAGDQCRLLFLMSIPYASNLQEKFLQSRMNASVIFYDRNRTRLIQAIGRCTRSPKDYSAICVVGDRDLSEWLLLKDKNKYLHPELQAELEFGITNSENVDVEGFVDNFKEFLNQTSDWQVADKEIIELRNSKNQEVFPGADQLSVTAALEVKFQYALWNKKYEEAFDVVTDIISKLAGGPELKGYRAFWNYQAGVISSILFKELGKEIFKNNSDEYFDKLDKICPSATWCRTIGESISDSSSNNSNLIWNIERLQNYLSENNITNRKKYYNYLRSIENFIDNNDLENLNLNIGRLLGFESENPTGNATPDPYWRSDNNYVIVFEDKYYDSEDGEIGVTDIRQAASHHIWIEKNLKSINPDVEIKTVVISNRVKVSKEGLDIGGDLLYWNYLDFVSFSRSIISLARDYQKFYSGENDAYWKEYFIDEFSRENLLPKEILNNLKTLKEKNL